MGKQTLTIKDTGQKIEVTWGAFWRNITVSLEGHEVGRFQNFKELKEGKTLKTPIGDVFLEYKQSMWGQSGIVGWYDNAPLLGGADDPRKKWRMGYGVAIGLGLFNMVIGGIALSSRDMSVDTLMIIGEYTFGFGVALLLLGLWAWKRQSAIALGLAAFLFGADGALVFLGMISMGQFNIFALFLRIAFVVAMAQGAMVAGEIAEREKAKNS